MLVTRIYSSDDGQLQIFAPLAPEVDLGRWRR